MAGGLVGIRPRGPCFRESFLGGRFGFGFEELSNNPLNPHAMAVAEHKCQLREDGREVVNTWRE